MNYSRDKINLDKQTVMTEKIKRRKELEEIKAKEEAKE